MDWINIIGGPLIGGVIGYFTNYLAVKMLFRPLYPIKIAGHTLPFTPGMIPRRRDGLAKAVGKAIGESLLTKADIESVLLSKEMEEAVAQEICNVFFEEPKELERQLTIKNVLQPRVGTAQYAIAREHLEEHFCEKILSEIQGLGIGDLVAGEGSRVLHEKMEGSFLEKIINDDMISSLIRPVGEYVEKYLGQNGHDMILPLIERQLTELEERPLPQLLDQAQIEKDSTMDMVKKGYREIVEKKAGKWVEKMGISSMVESKICEMDLKEMEELVLTVMGKELKAIVNLGALIGFVIGILNIFL